MCFFMMGACDNNIDADFVERSESSLSLKLYPESFKPNDKEYPYAEIPRIVIETENRSIIKDRQTEVSAKLQIWGKKKAESDVLDLTIRGRGNSSWGMPKKSYKIEFEEKQSLFDMPQNKDWALIANYTDKTLMRNYIAYRLSAALGAYYAPRCKFVELYLNGEYLGVYLLTETIKIGKNRVNIPKDDFSYIVEVDGKYKKNEQVVFSDVITENGTGKAFRVHYPQNANLAILDTIQNNIQKFETFLKSTKSSDDNAIGKWLDIDESIKHYWVQEFTRNPDATFYTSVFFSWVKGEKIKMGPVWDFDLAFGNHSYNDHGVTTTWRIRQYWYRYLFNNDVYKEKIAKKWKESHHLFESVLDMIDESSAKLKKAVVNNFKRWDILQETENGFFISYESYDAAVDDLKDWVKKRLRWVNAQHNISETIE